MSNHRAGTIGTIETHHRSDRPYPARAVVLYDQAADEKLVQVILLEDWYCLERGDHIEHPAELFTPDDEGE